MSRHCLVLEIFIMVQTTVVWRQCSTTIDVSEAMTIVSGLKMLSKFTLVICLRMQLFQPIRVASFSFSAALASAAPLRDLTEIKVQKYAMPS